MKKLSRLFPPIIAIILVVVVTAVLVLHFTSTAKSLDQNNPQEAIDTLITVINYSIYYIVAFVIGVGGFISLLVSVKWLFESIYAIRDNN